jgi:hypothetical protein
VKELQLIAEKLNCTMAQLAIGEWRFQKLGIK